MFIYQKIKASPPQLHSAKEF